jgi:serine/threonine-protein kinase
VTSSLQHPGIVQVIDFNETSDGVPYLVMEYLDGGDLAEVIARAAPLPVRRVANVVEQIASALAAAHRRDIVHRDLKPQNVFVLAVDGRDVVKLVDFGISKIRSASQHLTRESTLLGTPQYMAPEQATGSTEAVDARSDQFALAAIAYEMLGGRPPFTGDSLPAVVYQIVEVDPPPLAAVPPAVEAVVRRGLAKRPEARFQSVTDFAAALSAAARGETAPAEAAAAGAPPAAPLRGAIPDRGGSGRATQAAFADTTLGTTAGELATGRTAQRRRRARAVLLAAVTGVSAALAVALLWSRAPNGIVPPPTGAYPAGGAAPHATSTAPAVADPPGSKPPPVPARGPAPPQAARPQPVTDATASEGAATPPPAPASASASVPASTSRAADASKRPHRPRAKRAVAAPPETQAPAKKIREALVDDL